MLCSDNVFQSIDMVSGYLCPTALLNLLIVGVLCSENLHWERRLSVSSGIQGTRMPDGWDEMRSQDEIARIRKRKRGRNMLNRSGNTTDNLCFRYRFRDVFSRFRCCVYNGTGPLFVHVKHNGNMELHVSARNTETCDFVLWIDSYDCAA